MWPGVVDVFPSTHSYRDPEVTQFLAGPSSQTCVGVGVLVSVVCSCEAVAVSFLI